MTDVLIIDGGDITSVVPKTDYQVQIPLVPIFSSGTWTATDNTEVIFYTRTPGNTTSYFTMPIIVPSRTTALKGASLKSVTVIMTLAGTCDTTNDDLEINIIKVITPVDGSPATGSVLAGDASADYPTAQNSKAKRLTVDDHTYVVSIPEGEQAYMDTGEQYYVRVKVTDNANADLLVAIKGATATFDFNAL